MPAWDEIPDEFKRHRGNQWTEFVGRWFSRGLPADVEFYGEPDIDPETALNHIRTILGSFEPKHEHKEAACAYLCALWFKRVTGTNIDVKGSNHDG